MKTTPEVIDLQLGIHVKRLNGKYDTSDYNLMARWNWLQL